MSGIYTGGRGATISYGDPNAMLALSSQLIYAAETYLAQLGSAASSLVPPVINPVFPSVDSAPTPMVIPAPTLLPVTWTVPSDPGAFTATLDTTGDIPTFSGVQPTLAFGTAPAAFSDTAPSSPSVDLNFTYPTVSVSFPTAPTLLSISDVQFGGVTIPTFDAVAPTLTAVAPSIKEYIPGSLYTSTLLTSVQTTLNARVTSGTDTGLPGDIETALWDRAREREYRQQRDALAALDRDAEVMGFAFPPGVYMDARLKIYTETNNTIAGLSREIMIKQAELHLDNIHKAIQESITLEGQLINYQNATEQRTFEACKYVTEAGVEIYNAKVRAYTASAEVYKASAMAYEYQIRGALAIVEVYKAQVTAEQVKAQINTALVEQYKTEIDAQMAYVQIYKAQLEALQVRANVEKLKVDVFGEQVRAFTAQINAYTAEIEGYKAGIEAEATKQAAYKTSVDAYSAEVGAAVKVIDAKIAAFRGQIDAYTAQLTGYKSRIEAMVGQAQAANYYNTAAAEVYRAEVSGASAYNDTLTKQWQAVIDLNERVAEVAVKAAEANGQLYISSRSLAMDASKVGAQVNAQLGAAALNAIHWSNSVSSSWSDAQSLSQSESTSYSTSNSSSVSSSTSESVNFNYSASV